MFEIDLSAAKDGEWFRWQNSHFDPEKKEFVFDPPDTDARVRVRRPNQFIAERIAARPREVEHVLNPQTRSMERMAHFKDQTPEEARKESEDTWDFMITGLENFKDKATGKVLECSRENKIALMRAPAFDRFVGKCLRILDGIEKREAEQAEKN